MGLESRVAFIGARTDVWPVYGALDVLAVPSRWEGFGIVLLEAMACGIPVVATRVGGIPEVVVDGETGKLVPPGDPAALAKEILALVADPARAAELGRKGQERVRTHFNIDDTVRRLEKIYAE